MNPCEIPLHELVPLLREGHLSLELYIESSLAEVERREAEISALLPEEGRRERLLREARTLCERFPAPAQRPPLFGVLVGVKDMFRADGFPTQAGSRLPPALFEGAEAEVVSLLKRAGALVLGKTVTTEFAYFEPGPTRNPRNPAHTPGGSSSGSAAAVAAGYCAVSLGTQTIGSITRPASYCGVVGFKPTYGRISCAGVIPFSPAVDHVGFFTTTVGGVAPVAALLVDNWSQGRWQEATPRRPVLAVPMGGYLAQAEPETLAVFERQCEQLERLGYSVRRLAALEDVEALNALHRQLVAAELAQTHRDWFDAFGPLYRAGTRELIQMGRGVPREVLEKGLDNRAVLRSELESRLQAAGCDLWIMPSTRDAAPLGLGATGSPLMNLPWTHAGLPTLSIPAGQTASGMPLGLQLAAVAGADEPLVAWGMALEIALYNSSSGRRIP